MIRAIAVSSIERAPQLEIAHEPADVFFRTNVCCRSLSSVVKRAHASEVPPPQFGRVGPRRGRVGPGLSVPWALPLAPSSGGAFSVADIPRMGGRVQKHACHVAAGWALVPDQSRLTCERRNPDHLVHNGFASRACKAGALRNICHAAHNPLR